MILPAIEDDMQTKLLIIAGAGCTLSDAMNQPISNRPPLDRGFFRDVSRTNYTEFDIIRNYLRTNYDFDPTERDRDSLESVMAIIYADLHNPTLAEQALETFRGLITLFNRRIAQTTNNLYPTNRFKLYRILAGALDYGISPEEITIITFNQDIQIEKILQKLQATGRKKRCGRIFNFPFCYNISNASGRLSSPPKRIGKFEKGDQYEAGIRLLKLHGSLNWYSIHNSKKIPKNSILNSSRKFQITPRATIEPDMTFTAKRKRYTFPLVIPPVTHKAGILHQDLHPIWNMAETALKYAIEIVVFGYSCPANDFESANLIRRTVHLNQNLKEFSVIDPTPEVFQRYVDLAGIDRLYYFKKPESYLKS